MPGKRGGGYSWEFLGYVKPGSPNPDSISDQKNVIFNTRFQTRLFTVPYFSVRSSRYLTVNGGHRDFKMYRGGGTHARWQLVRRAISRRSHGKIGDCEKSIFRPNM